MRVINTDGRRTTPVPGLVRPFVEAVNVGQVGVLAGRRPRRTAIVKRAVSGPVRVSSGGLEGDEQADLSVHGGCDKAVHAYAIEDIRYWEAEFDCTLGAGAFGENLTLRGMDPNAAVIGERWTVGTTLLEVSQPRFTCATLGVRVGDPSFVRRFANGGRPGVYLRVLQEGLVRAGDPVEVVLRPAHGVTARLVFDAALDHALATRALDAAELPADLRQWLEGRAR